MAKDTVKNLVESVKRWGERVYPIESRADHQEKVGEWTSHKIKYMSIGTGAWAPMALVLLLLLWLAEKTIHLAAALISFIPWVNTVSEWVSGPIGIVALFVILYYSGLFAANETGKKAHELVDKGFEKLPLYGTVRDAVKQLVDKLTSEDGFVYEEVGLTRSGLFPGGFMYVFKMKTFRVRRGDEEELWHVIFIMTSPGPFNGYWGVIPDSEYHATTTPVDAAFAQTIKMGMGADVQLAQAIEAFYAANEDAQIDMEFGSATEEK